MHFQPADLVEVVADGTSVGKSTVANRLCHLFREAGRSVTLVRIETGPARPRRRVPRTRRSISRPKTSPRPQAVRAACPVSSPRSGKRSLIFRERVAPWRWTGLAAAACTVGRACEHRLRHDAGGARRARAVDGADDVVDGVDVRRHLFVGIEPVARSAAGPRL